MYYHRNWNINFYNSEVGLMKKFLKENWQNLIIAGISIGISAGISITIISKLLTWLMNALLWVLEVLITHAA